MELCLEPATAADDPAIRRLLSRTPVPGRVSLTYEREPDYFLGCSTMGQEYQVVVDRLHPSGQVVGVACRAIATRFVNGRLAEVGYLGQLRADPRFRGRWLLARAFRLLRETDGAARVEGYLATITEENREALGLLVRRPRRRLPVFRHLARLQTLALIVRRPRAVPPSPYTIRRGSVAQLEAIVAFLRRHGAARQFFPLYSAADFLDGARLRGFDVGDFVLAWRGGELAGAAGLWDQSGYKQLVVRGYHGLLRWARPVYNLGVSLCGGRPLPAPGQALRCAYASFICVAGNDREIFRPVLREVYNLAAARGYAFLLVGLAAHDPLLAEARRYAHIAYGSSLYSVCWDDQGHFHERLDGRLPGLEIATL
ncbi:MAG TPA: hypothetical protein VHS99_05320 [Chloroflexota bacterium]|nr:hypothetical protein [Chloroflexota bacterium]